MEVCIDCGDLTRSMLDCSGPIQVCRCTSGGKATSLEFESPLVAELCPLCAATVIATGSRWSPVLCGPCTTLAKDLNLAVGFVVIPTARHTLSIQSTTKSNPAQASMGPSRLANELGGLHAGLEALDHWRRATIRGRTSLLGSTTIIDLDLYLERSGEEGVDRVRLAWQFYERRCSAPTTNGSW